ncbi:MAG: DUF418 domain-containing protein [Candidatus Solibacter usitatus]|nr:DUF418 domain-containing protein [Candidatus Solibacter usitatus]
MQRQESDRIVILDLLRGIALLGMILVHFNDKAMATSGLGKFTSAFVELFVENKSYTTFAMLFGVGFALQIRAAQARGEASQLRLLRRLLGLGLFGIIAEGVFGFGVLIGYAMWGVPLLVMWRWSARALLIATVLCAASLSLFELSAGAYQWATLGVESTRAANKKATVSQRATRAALRTAETQASFTSVVAARMKHLPWQHTRSFAFTPWGPMVVFLVGLLALRHGILEHPEQHQRLIVGAMAAGVLSWAISHWVLPLPWPVLPIGRVAGPIREGFRIIRDDWLALTYIGAVLLVTSSWPKLVAGLDWFVGAGRLALTNYMIQIVVIDVLTREYGFKVKLSAEHAPFAAFGLFAVLALFSRYWLQGFRTGPCEWLLRAITYWKIEPMRRGAEAASVMGAPAKSK